ncbi:MAG: hypothetical protein IIC21_08890 [Chloroflexi bacterium]|nr:hypothetical protein [Chloroflexota bacterium]
MEGFALTLIGGAIFIHSLRLLGICTEDRATGALMAALAAGLLLTLTFEPQLLGTQGTNPIQQLAEVTVMKSLIVMWAVYAAAVAAQVVWDLDERAIGFYGVGLVAAGGAAFIYYVAIMIGVYTSVMLEFTIVSAALVLVAALIIALMAVPVNAMRGATGWAMLSLSIIVAAIGLAMYTTIIAFS